jgi:hypothetical protein
VVLIGLFPQGLGNIQNTPVGLGVDVASKFVVLVEVAILICADAAFDL